jgi:hypothetical protein
MITLGSSSFFDAKVSNMIGNKSVNFPQVLRSVNQAYFLKNTALVVLSNYGLCTKPMK